MLRGFVTSQGEHVAGPGPDEAVEGAVPKACMSCFHPFLFQFIICALQAGSKE